MQVRPIRRNREAFTLIELVVVMFILMALAAIVVPLFPNMIERAHRASQATNESEVTKAVQLYQSLNGNYPDGYDLLTDGTAGVVNYLPSSPTASPMPFGETPAASVANVVDGSTYPCGGYVQGGTLTANQVTTLNGAGIASEYPMLLSAKLQGTSASVPSSTYAGTLAWQSTFNPYQSDTPAAIPLVAGTPVVTVNPSGILISGLGNPSILNPDKTHTGQFVMFGLGKRCSMIGTVMSNAGSNFPNDAVHENPNVVYQRFGLVYQLEDASGNALPAAVCLGAVAIEANIMLATDGTMASYSQNVPQISSPAAGPGE